MTGTLPRLVSFACALAALLVLSFHVMPANAGKSAPSGSVHAAHDGGRPGADPTALASACAQHCLASAFLPAEAAPVPTQAFRPVRTFGAPVRLAGLSPHPSGPPPKLLASS